MAAGVLKYMYFTRLKRGRRETPQTGRIALQE